MKFAVIDVETTGLNPTTDRITELGVVIIENFEIKSSYNKLVRSEITIPEKVTAITGINSKLLQDAPSFDEISEEVNSITKDCIVVGHRVQFDYSFLKNEMKRTGAAFSRKTLCTAEFAQLLHPSARSFSLASLCKLYSVTNKRPHRAMPDAEATAEIFLQMAAEKGHDFIASLYSVKNISKLIPAHLRETVYKKLPSTPGVYYFIGKNNKPVYIGKAAKIKSRVLSHFRGEGNSLKILATAAGIKEIRFRETGNELLATLLEDHEIRHYWPGLNAAQKKNITKFGIVFYMDQLLQWRMGITRGGKQHCFATHFHQYHLATEFIREQAQRYDLDSSLCGLPSGKSVEVELHNQNFLHMIKSEKDNTTAEIFLSKGRTEDELGFIWVEKGHYKGFGFVSNKKPLSDELLLENLTLRYSSVTSENIINNLLKTQAPALIFPLK